MASYAHNVPISAPVLHPAKELADWFGFTFSHELGVHPQYVPNELPWQELMVD